MQTTSTMTNLLARNWKWLLWRGIAGILFGIVALCWPGLTLLALVFIYGAYALVDGVFALGAACTGGSALPRWWLVLSGLLGIAAGIVVYAYPGASVLVLTLFLGCWILIRGIFEIIGALQVRKDVKNEGWLILSGLLSVILGGILIWSPGLGALSLVWVLGMFALVFGITMVMFALRLRKQHNSIVS